MPFPLSDAISDQLKSPTIALAALFLIANHHRDALLWVARTVGPTPPLRRKARRKAPHSNGSGDRDESLVEAMKADPSASIGAV